MQYKFRCYGTNICHSRFYTGCPFQVPARSKKNGIESFFNISGDGLFNLPVTKEDTGASTVANTITKYPRHIIVKFAQVSRLNTQEALHDVLSVGRKMLSYKALKNLPTN